MPDSIAEVKQKLDIVDVVSSYVPVKKAGRNYKGVCPFHSEDTPSFMVSPELQIFKCFGCGEAGDMFAFIQKIEGVEFAQALELLAERAGVKIEREQIDPRYKLKNRLYKVNQLSAQFYNYLLTKHKLGKEALSYLKKDRKLSDQTIKDFMIGYAPDSWSTLHDFLSKKGVQASDMLAAGVVSRKKSGSGFVDRFRGRVMFPLVDVNGKVAGFTGRTVTDATPKYLNTSETPVFYKSFYLYGLDKAKIAIKKEGAIFVEGQVDVITAYQKGIRNVIATSGTALTDNQLKILARYTKDLTFCFDPDSAGVIAMHRAIELADNHDFNIKAAVVPDEYSDLDEFINADVEGAKDMLRNSIPVYDFFLMAALKKHDKHTALGKKKIMEELVPRYSHISSSVLLDHYAKKLAEELDLSAETVFSALKKGSVKGMYPAVAEQHESEILKKGEFSAQKTPESYLLVLLLQSSPPKMREYIEKADLAYFVDPHLQLLFKELVSFLDGVAVFDTEAFVESLSDELKILFTDLYMRDIETLSGDEKLLTKEIESVLSRLRKRQIRAEMEELSQEIKAAESARNTKLLNELTTKFNEISQELL